MATTSATRPRRPAGATTSAARPPRPAGATTSVSRPRRPAGATTSTARPRRPAGATTSVSRPPRPAGVMTSAARGSTASGAAVAHRGPIATARPRPGSTARARPLPRRATRRPRRPGSISAGRGAAPVDAVPVGGAPEARRLVLPREVGARAPCAPGAGTRSLPRRRLRTNRPPRPPAREGAARGAWCSEARAPAQRRQPPALAPPPGVPLRSWRRAWRGPTNGSAGERRS